MKFIETGIQDLYIIEPQVFGDQRGFFLESYSQKAFREHGLDIDFVQDNHAKSRQIGVLRGLHFQRPPQAQTKLVRVTRGKVYDVAVDIRQGSASYGRWFALELSSQNQRMLLIPQGFAHGYCTLEEDTEFLYKVDNFYAPECDDGIIWNDADLAIPWPCHTPILSAKDEKLSPFNRLQTPFVLQK